MEHTAFPTSDRLFIIQHFVSLLMRFKYKTLEKIILPKEDVTVFHCQLRNNHDISAACFCM